MQENIGISFKKSLKNRLQLVVLISLLTILTMAAFTPMAFAKVMDSKPADKLVVEVKYSDNTTEKVKEYSVGDLQSLGNHEEVYTFIDSLPCAVICKANGTYISELLADLAYKTSDVESIQFASSDGGFKTIAIADLLNGYVFPHIADNYERENSLVFKDITAAKADSSQVEAMLAFDDDWRRVVSGATFEASEMIETTDNCFRLMLGSAEDLLNNPTPNAPNSLKWVYQITLNTSLTKPVIGGGGSGGSGSKPDVPKPNPSDEPTKPTPQPEKPKPATGVKLPSTAAVDGTLLDLNKHWAAKDIYKLVALGAINGNPDGTFKPDDSITRGEFVTILVKALVKSNKISLGGISNFADCKGHWAESYIAAAIGAGIVKGVSATEFTPNAQITREEMAVMISKAVQLPASTAAVSFKDADKISVWATSAVQAVVASDIMSGEKGFFRATEKATRAEASSVILRAFLKQGYLVE